jgi:hypothetical protein
MYHKSFTKSRAKDRKLQKNYQISLDDYQIMFDEHNGKCAICEKDYALSERNLNVDHDHITNKVRGLLCNQCNLGLGLFKDSFFLLEKAATYIKSYSVPFLNPLPIGNLGIP